MPVLSLAPSAARFGHSSSSSSLPSSSDPKVHRLRGHVDAPGSTEQLASAGAGRLRGGSLRLLVRLPSPSRLAVAELSTPPKSFSCIPVCRSSFMQLVPTAQHTVPVTHRYGWAPCGSDEGSCPALANPASSSASLRIDTSKLSGSLCKSTQKVFDEATRCKSRPSMRWTRR
jgi:hypothetical protein